MITLHESNITSFPLDNGIGVLKDAIQAYAEEELNGMFEFYMEYDSEGHLVDELKEERIIRAKAQDKLGYQLFRIYSIEKNHANDNLIVKAQHITYDLAKNFVESLEADNMTKKQVMEAIGSRTAYPHPFNITSSNDTTRSSTHLYRTNPLQMVAGMEGSVLQIWGGQIERDNFNLILHDRRGSDDGVLVTYKKNLTGLNATFDISNLVTRIYPFVFREATETEPEQLITVPGKYIDSPHIDDYETPYILPVDMSSDMDIQTSQDLLNAVSNWFVETGRDKIQVEMEVQFEHLWETEEYKDLAALELVGMGDTVTINHSKLKVNATAIVNYIRYDCIAEKNEEVRLGSVKARLTDSVNRVVNVAEKAEQAEQTANQAIRTANGKNTVYYGPDEPTTGNKDDIWFRVVDGEYTRTYRFDGIEWQLVLSVDARDAMDEAQQAKDEAQSAVDRANSATQQATNAINQAQTAFDDAQLALTTVTGLQGDVTNLSTLVDDHTGQISAINQSVAGLQTQVSDAEGNITVLQQTSSSLAGRLSDTEDNITTLTATAQGLQTQVSNLNGDVSNVTQIATALQTRITNAEGNISSLTQTANSLQSTISSVRNDLDNLEIGGRNLVPGFEVLTRNDVTVISNSKIILHATQADQKIALHSYRRIPVEPNTTYTFHAKQGQWEINERDENNNVIRGIKNPVEEGEILTFTTHSDCYNIGLFTHNDSAGDFVFEEPKLEKGTKATDWTPAPEDMATQSQISQLASDINLRVQKGDVINQINLDTSGALISGKSIILDGNTTVRGTFKLDGSAHIKDASIGTAQIGTIDASKISTGTLVGIDIQGARFYSTSGNDWMSLIGGNLEMQKLNGTYLTLNPDGLHGYNADGTLRFNLDKTWVSTSAVGTTNANVYLAAVPGGGGGEARVVNYNDIPGDGYVDSYRYLPMRASGFYGNYLNVNTAVPGGAANLYLRPLSGGEVRVTLNETTTNYQDLRADWIYANRIIPNTLQSNQNHFYLGTINDGELRVVNNDTTDTYRPVRASGFYGDFIDKNALSGGVHIYVRPAGDPGELRVTVRNTTDTYRPVRARDFITDTSLRENKKDISVYEENTLDVWRNASIYTYHRKTDEPTAKLQLGMMLDEMPSITYSETGDSFSLYALTSYIGKGLKDLISVTDDIKDEVNWLKLENQYLKQKIKILEEKVA